MQVVSGRVDRPKIHFEAPPRNGLEAELDKFIQWFNEPPAHLNPLLRADRVLSKTRFWQRHATTVLNERQIKVLNRLLDATEDKFAQGINARKYQSLTKVSKATAIRDLIELLDKGCLERLPGGGCSTRYVLAPPSSKTE